MHEHTESSSFNCQNFSQGTLMVDCGFQRKNEYKLFLEGKKMSKLVKEDWFGVEYSFISLTHLILEKVYTPGSG